MVGSSRLLVVVALVGIGLVGCGGGGSDDAGPADAPEPELDAGRADAGAPCDRDEDCDDGLYCTGAESCVSGACTDGAPPACDDGIACTRDLCSEERGACLHQVPDVDRDGLGDAACVDGEGEPLGTDCDDADADRFPGNVEVCDVDGHDEDCDAATLGGLDADGDGEVSAACCNPDASDATRCGTDCDDARRAVLPGGTEACNGIDDDCDGMIDEGVLVTTYADVDRDGVGDPDTAAMGCAGASGRSSESGDCDDTRPDRRPGQPEFCDLVDNDCDGAIDEAPGPVLWYRDADGDRFGDPASSVLSCTPVAGASLLGTDCDDGDAAIHPAAAELCDGRDNDCSGGPDFRIAAGDFEDDDGDGYVDIRCGAPLGVDCRDDDPHAGPGEDELCDGRDNDCDESIDEDVTSYAWYRDADGDGFGTESSSTGVVIACMAIPGHVRRGGDCDDDDAARSPGALESCNGDDDDCDSAVDEQATTGGSVCP